MAGKPLGNIPDEHTLLRYVSPARLRRDGETDAVVGVLPDAFRLRPVDEYLSAGWLDRFTGERPAQLAAARAAYAASDLKVKPNGGFAIGQVANIKAAGEKFGKSFRIVHEPEPDLECHVAVRRYQDHDLQLLALLADEAWSEWILLKDC